MKILIWKILDGGLSILAEIWKSKFCKMKIFMKMVGQLFSYEAVSSLHL
jgi:hypothetical protein